MSKRVLAGMRPTGRLHLGNYLGAAKGMVELQENGEFETFYMVVDVHAITTPYNSKILREDKYEVVKEYLACGLDPNKSAIFFQSDVSEHAELAFYLSSFVNVARMQHLPTYKDKVKQYPESSTMALLNYPILMAGDILLYRASYVPVGIDQEPHLEVAREIARKLNSTYGLDFPEPQRFATKGEYIPSLTGEGKMSKTVHGSSIYLTDSKQEIQKKLASVPTDSGKGSSIPQGGGVATLFKLVEFFMDDKELEQYKKAYLGEGIRYKDLKESLAEAIYKDLAPIQEKKAYYDNREDEVEDIVKSGAKRAKEVASKNLTEIKQKMGF